MLRTILADELKNIEDSTEDELSLVRFNSNKIHDPMCFTSAITINSAYY